MLLLPKEKAVLCQTKLSLVIAEAAGHDPVKATGLVLAHLPGICAKTDPAVAQLWVLRSSTQPPEKPWDRLRKIAERSKQGVNELYRAVKLPDGELKGEGS